ncbi:hypothetical protein BJ912DRAFT_1044807 [Pholiota molesta]|nr:hypothetical protein BJ912DRAFT_1044807 [Pholiota molesta]
MCIVTGNNEGSTWFATSPAQSDLDVAHGIRAREILELHWDTWITEQDWEWMSEHGFNSVRIPVSTNSSPSRVLLSPCRTREAEQRRSCWYIRARQLFNDSHNQTATIHALCSLVKNIREFTNSFSPPLSNIVGIELLNEPSPPSDRDLKQWYKRPSRASAPSTLPSRYTSATAGGPKCTRTNRRAPASTALTVWITICTAASPPPTHPRPAEAHSRASQTRTRHTHDARQRRGKAGRAGGGIVIGEWSGALNPGRVGFVRKGVCGWFSGRTRKNAQGTRGGVCGTRYRRMSFRASLASNPTLARADDGQLQGVRDSMRDQALSAHTQYWSQYPGRYHHGRFNEGYLLGWDDAFRFIASTPRNATTINEIGFQGAWASGGRVGKTRITGNLKLDSFKRSLQQQNIINVNKLEYLYTITVSTPVLINQLDENPMNLRTLGLRPKTSSNMSDAHNPRSSGDSKVYVMWTVGRLPMRNRRGAIHCTLRARTLVQSIQEYERGVVLRSLKNPEAARSMSGATISAGPAPPPGSQLWDGNRHLVRDGGDKGAGMIPAAVKLGEEETGQEGARAWHRSAMDCRIGVFPEPIGPWSQRIGAGVACPCIHCIKRSIAATWASEWYLRD